MKYINLGNLIKSEREKRSWEQVDLAKRMAVTQQTVSRWEKGDSRPKQDDLSKLVDLFSGENHVWFTKAGYDFDEPDTSLSPYLPVQNLSAENFEVFCRDLVQALNPGADVHRYGTQGHKQEGIDLYAQIARTILDYQCKRHKQFGAADIKTAIKKTTLKAKHHFLLLSRTATPPARKEIQAHRNWTLWDREDISAKVRSLPKDEAIRLVDAYFPGKRKTFLGVDEPSPWLISEDYFYPFANRLKLFSHGWNFVGRSKELELLKEFEKQSNSQAILISGRGGIGKSRLLRAWAVSIGKKGNVRFLSPGSEVDAASLELLPSGPAFLVIDDAHDRSDISTMLYGIARTRPEMKVIISTRPYGVTSLKDELSKSGLSCDVERIISLSDLTVEDAKALAQEILSDPNIKGKIQHAQRIAEITKDCPLATVIGSRLVGQGTIKPELLNNDRKFRDELLSRFRDVVAGEVGGPNAEEVSDLLDLLSMVQPFNPSDPNFQKSVEEILGKPYDKVLRHISLLEDSGVLLRRGHRLRVVPDLLADYIRARAAYDEKNQTSTGYADRVFEKLHGEYATNLLVNISQLDWRLSSEGVRTSLLDEVWSNLNEQFRKAKIYERAEILDAIKKLSYYQPSNALDFIRLALAEPTDEVEYNAYAFTTPSYKIVLEKISPILLYVAYNMNYLAEALDILKELAEKDNRPPHSHPDHPIRILQDIASIEPGKPLFYNDAVANHAIGWLKQPSTTVNFSPFDVLDVLLKTEGHQTESKGYHLIMKAYKILPKVVSTLRERIINEAFDVVNNKPLNESMRALKTLTEAMSYPMGLFGQSITATEKAAWEPGILSVLEGLKKVIANPNIDPFIAVEIRSMVSWHASLGSPKTKAAAREVLRSIPETLDYEISRAIADGWGMTFEKDDGSFGRSETALVEWRKKLVNKLIKKYKGNLSALIQLLEDRITVLSSAKMVRTPDAGPFLGAILEGPQEFTSLLGQYLLSNSSSPLMNWFGGVITVMANHDRSASLELIKEALKKDEIIFTQGVAWSLGWGHRNLEVVPEEIQIIKGLALSIDPWVRRNIVRSVKRFPKESKSVALDILLSISITDATDVAEEVFSEFDEKYGAFKTEDLTDSQLQKLLDSLVTCPSINEYHIGLLLSKTSFTHPTQTLKMLMDRIEYHEVKEKAEGYNPLSFSLREVQAFRFYETNHYEQLLVTLRDWATKSTGSWIRSHYGAELFKLVSAGFGEATLKVLDEWIMSSDKRQLESAVSLLSEAPNSFVWERSEFVIRILEQAHKFGNASYERVCSSLYSSVIQGGRSGTPGQPFPEDITQRDRSLEMLSKLPIGSPAHKFYKTLYDEAITNIKRRTYDENEFDEM